ncbi:hypothetical protein DU57_14000 [Methanosarcina mazei]|uniref:Type I restriction modification DNA specificity domain-containing protein n=1 Tax=Methanosarcina mazei TaxID=2209 RepID=A0A0F8IHB2_METMZ|nr:restriction endonuclease subunit S [Methanosarcina mazei]KKG88765.1 hypothetical protein DU57_14000 [Methanosarcina mazei]KKG89047.1 hypothetical protein DU59_13310 [Methanosarcina mazei]KKH10753.1 hypothetical protein DU42_14930 [Methanosarcina mazei]
MNSWKTVKLREVATIDRSSIQPEQIKSGTIYVGLEHIESGGSFVGIEHVDAGVLSSTKFQFTEHHVLYGKLRPYLAKIACPEFSGICSTDILPILPGPEIEQRYLSHFLRQPSMIDYASSLAVGANLPRLSPSVLEEFLIPLPSLEEQKRIADILDCAEALRAKRRTTFDQLDELKKAIFIDMFGDPFTQNDNIIRLSDVADIFMGQSPSGSSYNSEGIGTPLLNGPTEFGELCPTEKQWTTKPTRLCEVGDILFCVRGATAGRLNRADKVYCLGRGLAAIRPRIGTAVNANFLFTMLDHYYEYFQTKGVGSTFINISRKELEDLPIPKVHNDKANIFSQRVEIIDKLKANHRSSLAELDDLFASLQYRAFRGEL